METKFPSTLKSTNIMQICKCVCPGIVCVSTRNCTGQPQFLVFLSLLINSRLVAVTLKYLLEKGSAQNQTLDFKQHEIFPLSYPESLSRGCFKVNKKKTMYYQCYSHSSICGSILLFIYQARHKM